MSAKPGTALIQSDAGDYVAWSGADQPGLAVEGLGCGLLVLKPLGFAMPHYADTPKLGYVLGGSGVVGVLPVGASRERVVRLEAGDVMAVRSGDVSWWYNDAEDAAGEDDLSIVFMGDTARAVSPGDISYFILAGANGVLGGLDAGILARAWGLTEEQAAAAFRSQPAALLTKLSHKLHGVCPHEHDRDGLVANAARVPPDADGLGKTLTAAHLPALGDLGLSVVLARLKAGAVRAPWVLREGAAQAVYVARGSGRVQVSPAAGGAGDAAVLDEKVPAGSLLVVPRLAVACVAAGADGMEWVTVIKSARPVVEHLAGKGSVLGGIAAPLVQASLNVASELVELLVGKGGERAAPSN